MITQKAPATKNNLGSTQAQLPTFTYIPRRSVHYFGVVNYATTERVINEIKQMIEEDPHKDILLSVTSAGGPTGTAMSFFDHMHSVLKAPIITIGSGDVDSSGVLIFLSGKKRYLTKNTTLLLHPAGRVFEDGKRYTATEIEGMFREDNLKDYQYASVLAECSQGRLTTQNVLDMMEKNTILTPIEMINHGLADAIID